jgi:hypothetical protein
MSLLQSKLVNLMKTMLILLVACGFTSACRNPNSEYIGDWNQKESLNIPIVGYDEYSATTRAFEIYSFDRLPLVRVWMFSWTGSHPEIFQSRMFEVSKFRGRDYAALYSLEMDITDSFFCIKDKRRNEFVPKGGWDKLNAELKSKDIWRIPLLPFLDTVTNGKELEHHLTIEFEKPNERYRLDLPRISHLHLLSDKKSVAIVALFQIMKQEFGIDFLNFDFDKEY